MRKTKTYIHNIIRRQICEKIGHSPRRWYQTDTLCDSCGMDMKDIYSYYCDLHGHDYEIWNGIYKICITCDKVIDYDYRKDNGEEL